MTLRTVAIGATLLLATSAAAQTTAASIPVQRDELVGAIVGRVCRDRNGDGRCTDDEPGFGGVRVLLETGQTAITGPDT